MNLPSAKEYILQRLRFDLDSRLVYHSYEHTVDVYEAARELGNREAVPEEDQILLETAALFHDSGMLTGYLDHEEKSASFASEKLPEFGYTNDQISRIRQLILCTRLPQKAETRLEQILCDADLYYLGLDVFFINSFKLRLEWKLFQVHDYSLLQWFELQQKFLAAHRYFTDTARMERESGKKKNLAEIGSILHHPH
ncbi:MAG: HD domain-containing protein [bacterium]